MARTYRTGSRVRGALLSLALLLAPAAAAAQGEGEPAPQAPSPYQTRQSWFSRDKGLHFGVSAVGAAGTYVLSRHLRLNRWQSAATATLFMGTVGLLREVVDPEDRANYLSRRLLSHKDLVWDAAGIVVGITIPDLLMGSRPAARAPARVR